MLADEINRATPKTQSALLEAMEERQVTVDGVTHRTPAPFMVMATQNPIEYEGTFPLPEAQLDRFLIRLELGYPSIQDERAIMERQRDGHPVVELEQVCEPRRDPRASGGGARDLRRRARPAVHRQPHERHPQATIPSTSAPRRAARSRCSGWARRGRCSTAATSSCPTTSRSSPTRRWGTASS